MAISISEKTKLVDNGFNKLISALRPKNEVILQYETARSLSAEEATDSLDRFKLWAGNIGARHPPNSSLSVESRLVTAQELLDQASSLLDDLIEALDDLLEIITNSRPNRIIAAKDVPEGSNGKDAEYRERDEAQDILDVARECIRGLLKLSVLIRRATPRDRFAKALQRSDDNFLDEFDIAYVAERYPKLDRPTSRWLCERLGRAITKRRQFLRYSRDHRSRIEGDVPLDLEATTLDKTAAMFGKDTGSADRGINLRVAPTSIMESAHTKPSTKASTLDIAKLRAIEAELDDDGGSYISASSSIQVGTGDARLVLPALQDISNGQPTFECPLCFGIQAFKHERSWRRHAYQDLKAYVCILGNGQCDFELFGDSRTWFEHELQCHRRQFTCILCQSGPFRSEERFNAHVKKHHLDILLDQSQAPMILSASQRPIKEIPAGECPFCDEWAESLRSSMAIPTESADSIVLVDPIQFRRHVAVHQEQLALFAIPRGVTGNDDKDGSDDTDDGKSLTMVPGAASVGGSAADVHGQWTPDPPLHIAASQGNLPEVERLLAEGADVHSIGETWGTAMDAAANSEIRELLQRYASNFEAERDHEAPSEQEADPHRWLESDEGSIPDLESKSEQEADPHRWLESDEGSIPDLESKSNQDSEGLPPKPVTLGMKPEDAQNNSNANKTTFTSEPSMIKPEDNPDEQWQYDQSTLEKARAADVEELDEEGWRIVSLEDRIIELGSLGEGAGGACMKCKLKGKETVFALKIISTNPDPDVKKQLMREVSFNRECISEHICRYYGAFTDQIGSVISIAMEYCEGGSLDNIYRQLKRLGGRTGENVLGKIAEGVLRGLTYLHSKRIIHRDIKPGNILFSREGVVKLCDFGVSGDFGEDGRANTFIGTSYYMAPERITGQSYTITSDVWATGVTLLEVAQHRFPFPQDGTEMTPRAGLIDLLTYIVRQPVPQLKDEPDENIFWSADFKYFIECCLEKEPSRRASPWRMLEHPWVKEMIEKDVNMSRYLAMVWGWDGEENEVDIGPDESLITFKAS